MYKDYREFGVFVVTAASQNNQLQRCCKNLDDYPNKKTFGKHTLSSIIMHRFVYALCAMVAIFWFHMT